MSSEDHPCSAHVPSYTVEEIESITSEFIVKNMVSVLKSKVFTQETQLRWPRSSPRRLSSGGRGLHPGELAEPPFHSSRFGSFRK